MQTKGNASAHTPGPWVVEDPMGPESLWIVEAGKKPHEWRCIAMVCQDDATDSEDRDASVEPIGPAEQAANARLIAAAPDLLEALIEVMRHTREPITQEGRDIASRARAALSKAKGA